MITAVAAIIWLAFYIFYFFAAELAYLITFDGPKILVGLYSNICLIVLFITIFILTKIIIKKYMSFFQDEVEEKFQVLRTGEYYIFVVLSFISIVLFSLAFIVRKGIYYSLLSLDIVYFITVLSLIYKGTKLKSETNPEIQKSENKIYENAK